MRVSTRYRILFIIICSFTFLCCSDKTADTSFMSSFPLSVKRSWIGPEYWANPLQDWQLNNGRVECIVSGGDRNMVLLTRQISEHDGEFNLSVDFGRIGEDIDDEKGWVGFKVGVKGEFSDYRDSAVRGTGFPIGLTNEGILFIGSIDSTTPIIEDNFDEGKLKLNGKIVNGKVHLTLKLLSKSDEIIAELSKKSIDHDWISGMIAIVCHSGEILENVEDGRSFFSQPWGYKPGTGREGNQLFWFDYLKLEGSIVESYPKHQYGPILFSQYTLSKNILKLTAQMPPVGKKDDQSVLFQIKENGDWKTFQESKIHALSRTATFRIENWKSQNDIPYRLSYKIAVDENSQKTFYREGIIRKEPWNKEEIVVAGFTGNNDLGFPNNELVDAVKYHNPDILFFSGDQIYEGVGGYGIQTNTIENITLDYLRKWYLYGWAYGDLMRDRPTIAIPDDHDVYHGNIWGAGGKATPKGKTGANAQDAGGYKYFSEWVRVVERTQTSHLPDPYDPEPVDQNIGVYYTNMNYAGVSFGIIEDRKFKSAPKVLLPKAKVHNGWAQNLGFDAAKDGDVEGAVSLGARQLKFLGDWSSDWSDNTWMKVVLSQTIFANVATLPVKKSSSDAAVPSLKIFKTGEYPPDDIPVQDMDSNGWPQTPRNRALEIIRKAFAFHLAGDQHLGSTIQYGVNDWHDAGYAFCVPAISNVWPRRWFPSEEGKNRKVDMPKYTGDFKDGFGNLMSVHAVSNPFYSGKKPSKLYDRATGYGIVRFNRKTRDIKIECWPRWVDPSKENAKQYPGWPITINQDDNYNRKIIGYLPELVIKNMTSPVVQIINQFTNEIIYTKRIAGTSFKPPVFETGNYKIKVGELDTNKEKVFVDVKIAEGNESKIKVVF